MTEILRIGADIAKPLGMAGFICALIFYAYLRSLRHKEVQLAKLPEEKRAQVVDQYLSRYGLSAANLTRQQKFELLQQEMVRRDRRFLLIVLIGTATFVICLLFVLAAYITNAYANAGSASRSTKKRVEGLLEAAHKQTQDCIFNLQEQYVTENAGTASPIPPTLPDELLNTLRNDGEVYLLLSEPMRDRLGKYIDTLRTLREGYKHGASNDTRSKKGQPGTVVLMLNECSVIEICLRMEKEYQEGRLGAEQHARRFSSAESYGALFMLTGLCNTTDPDAALALKRAPLTEKEVGSHSFWAGHEFHSCVEVLNSGQEPNDTQMRAVRRVQRRLHLLGLRVDLRRLLTGARPESKRLGQIDAMIVAGLNACHGEKAVATMMFGAVFATTMNTYESFFADKEFRDKFVAENRNLGEVGAAINSSLDNTIMPDELKKHWLPLYTDALTHFATARQRASSWKKLVFDYYRDSLPEEGANVIAP
jgi:hypothetical protein